MKIVLIGAGNLATNLGKALFHAGHEILQVYSRTEESARALADVLKCVPHQLICRTFNQSADMFIISRQR